MIRDHDRVPSGTDFTTDPSVEDPESLERLRELLFGSELRELEELRRRLDALGITPADVAEQLPQAIAIRTGQDQQLARALGPTMDKAFEEAVQRHPDRISTAIFPIIGPAIRKSIAETMAGLVQTINRAIEHSLSWNGLKWRIESWRTGVPYGQVVIKHALIFRVEQIFLIHNETGLLLGHVTAEGLDTPDADVISGMLTAIRDFVQDSFATSANDGLRRMSVADYIVQAQPGPHATIGAVIRGIPPEDLDQRMQEILERIHLQFGSALAAFDGDAEPLEMAEHIMEEGLETVVMSDLPRPRNPILRVAWGMAALLLILGISLGVVRARTWSLALTALRAEPGIVVLEADRNFFGRSTMRGLWDPSGRRPNVVLAASDVDTLDVVSEWEPYLSYDPALAAAHAPRWLSAPTGVVFSFADGVLHATGEAPPSWIVQASARAPTIPGVSSFDSSVLRWVLSSELRQAQNMLDTLRINFAIGSASLSPDANTTLDSVASWLNAVVALAPGELVHPSVDVVGRTDTTGTNETNQILSLRRAETVLGALQTRGVPLDYLRPIGAGTTDPVVGADRATTARLNRSVSFILRYEMPDGSGERSR